MVDWAIETAPHEEDMPRLFPAEPEAAAGDVQVQPVDDGHMHYLPLLDDDLELPPGYIEVRSHELPRLMEILREKRVVRTNDRLVRSIEEHEADHVKWLKHFRAKRATCATQLQYYGRCIGDIEVGYYVTRGEGLAIPTLGMAAIAAAPLEGDAMGKKGPSWGDLQVLARLGYRGGVQEVGQRIEAWNAAGRKPYIPLPRTYVLGGQIFDRATAVALQRRRD